MLRLRLAPLAVAAGLLLACGCSTTSSCSSGSGGFFSRLCGRTRPAPDCCCAVESAAPCCTSGCCTSGCCTSGCCDGGPPLIDPGAAVVTPGAPAMPMPPPPGLPLAPAPRLVPQPVQSQPVPYNPPG